MTTETRDFETFVGTLTAVQRFAKRHPQRYRYQVLAARMNMRARRWGVDGHISGADLASIDGMCRYCAGPAGGFDHVIALADGGPNVVTNLVPACLTCNKRKASDLKRGQVRALNAGRSKYGRRLCGHAFSKQNRLRCPYCDDVAEPRQAWRRRQAGQAA